MTHYNAIESAKLIGGCIETSRESYCTLRKKNQRFELNKNHKIAYLKEGAISIYHSNTNQVILSIESPGVIGVEQLFQNEQPYYFRCERDSEIILIDEELFVKILTSFNLWDHTAFLLCSHLNLFFHREKMLSHKNNKGIVKDNLKYLWAQGEAFRQKTSLYSFIFSRTKISRSSLHKIIRQLNDENVINTQRGKLIWMSMDV